jgi:hypothetical protein
MSAQCYCYECAGCIVERRTFIAHGRMNQPTAASEQLGMRMVSVADDAAADDGASDATDWDGTATDSEEDSDECDGLHSDNDEGDDDNDNLMGRGQLTRKEITMQVLDWMTSKKVSDAAAIMMWEIVTLMMPVGVDPPSWPQIKRALRKAEQNMVKRIHTCVNDCIAFWNSTHLPESYRHAHRSKCPVCDEPRYVTDPADGKQKARRVTTRRKYCHVL